MGYLPSGTNYPAQTSNLFPGLAQGGNDYVAKFYNSSADLNNVSGVNAVISTSRQFINFSGTVTPVLILGAQEQELQSSVTPGYVIGASPQFIDVVDTFGGAAGQNIIVSGATSAVTINGASKVTAISTDYGKATIMNVSGNTWVKF
jgi:hypothetical protein